MRKSALSRTVLFPFLLLALTGLAGCWAEIDPNAVGEPAPSSSESDLGHRADVDSTGTEDLTPGVPWLDGMSVDSDLLADWTRAGGYLIWEHGPAPFRSTAGGGTRIYVNDILAASLARGASVHPVGSIGIREVYYDDLMTLRGVNLTIKLEDGESATNWLFVELYNLNPRGEPTVYERGAAVCMACHGNAPDFVRSSWPLQ